MLLGRNVDEREGVKIRKGDQPPIKCKLGLGLGWGEQSWLTEQEDLRVEGEMSESLFRIQHPLTPQL
jgi:hypothetical protein